MEDNGPGHLAISEMLFQTVRTHICKTLPKPTPRMTLRMFSNGQPQILLMDEIELAKRDLARLESHAQVLVRSDMPLLTIA